MTSFIMTRRDGTPIYESYRLKTYDDENLRIRYMLTMVFRCQTGSEIIPDYGFDLENAIADSTILKVLATNTLNDPRYYPGVSAIDEIETYISGNTGYISFIVSTESGSSLNMEVGIDELR